jgi:hypothetical protein
MVFAARNSSKEMKLLMRISRRLKETRRTKRKSNNDDDDDDKIPQIWRNYRVHIRVEPFVYL